MVAPHMDQSTHLLDKRVVDRNIRKGLVTREDYAKFLDQLPDRADQAVRLGDTDDDGDGSD